MLEIEMGDGIKSTNTGLGGAKEAVISEAEAVAQ
jgi:hypothetical protein